MINFFEIQLNYIKYLTIFLNQFIPKENNERPIWLKKGVIHKYVPGYLDTKTNEYIPSTFIQVSKEDYYENEC